MAASRWQVAGGWSQVAGRANRIHRSFAALRMTKLTYNLKLRDSTPGVSCPVLDEGLQTDFRVERTKTDNLGVRMKRPIIIRIASGSYYMAGNQVVLYFDRPEDALLFTLAASSVMSAEGSSSKEAVRVAQEICKASRITTEGALNPDEGRQN